MSKIKEGTLLQHKSGNCYTVLMLANVLATKPNFPLSVVYKRDSDGEIFSRAMVQMHNFKVVGQVNE